MIGVQISPPHPVLGRHFPEYRVRRTGLGQGIAEPVQRGEQRSNILAEIYRRRTAFALFHLRTGGHPLGPRQRHPQSGPLHQRSLPEACRRAGIPLSQSTLVGVIQMAHHLMRGHRAPARRIVGRKRRQSKGYILPIGDVAQSFHVTSLDDMRTATCPPSNQSRESRIRPLPTRYTARLHSVRLSRT
jgi:hypothetical protein